MKTNNFEELLKSKLDRTEVQPPADMWAKLEQRLPEIRRELSFGGEENPGTDEVLPAPKIRRPLRHKMRWAYVAASCGVVVTMVFALRNLQDAGTGMMAGTTDTTQTVHPAGTVTDPVTTDPVIEDIQGTPQGITTTGRTITGTGYIAANTSNTGTEGGSPATGTAHITPEGGSPSVGTTDNTGGQTATPGAEGGDTGREPRATDPEGGNSITGQGTQTDLQAWDGTRGQMSREEWLRNKRRNSGGRSNISTSVFAMNAAGTNNINGTINGGPRAYNSSLVVVDKDPDDGEYAYTGTRLTGASVKHDLPLSFGASVNFRVWNRLSLETGLTYTYMRSKGESTFGTSGATSTLTQKLHYMGVPVKVRYDFLHTRIVDVYGAGGGMLEMLMSGKQTLRNTDSNSNVTNADTSEKVKTGSLQASIGANVGVQFNIDKTFGFYLEPGVGYYFKNGNQPDSYRTENPFNFTIKAGFRVNL